MESTKQLLLFWLRARGFEKHFPTLVEFGVQSVEDLERFVCQEEPKKYIMRAFLGTCLPVRVRRSFLLMTVSRERMNPLSLATCSPPVHFDRFMDLERCLAAGLSLDAALQIQACLKKDSLHDGTNYSGSVPLPGGAASTTVEAKRRRSTRAQNWLRSLPAALALFDRRTLSTEEATGAPRFFPGQYVVYHAGCVVEWFLLGSACTTE